MSKFVCSVCGREPVPQHTPGTWKCACLLGSQGWVAGLHCTVALVPDKETSSLLSPVTDNPAEDDYYNKIEKRIRDRG